MFDKITFASIVKEICSCYKTQTEFSKKSGIGRTNLSSYMNLKCEKPPKENILKKLEVASKGKTSLKELEYICGYLPNCEFILCSCYKKNFDKHKKEIIELGIDEKNIRYIYLTFLGEYKFKENIRTIIPSNCIQNFICIIQEIINKTGKDYKEIMNIIDIELTNTIDILSDIENIIQEKIDNFESKSIKD